MKIEFKGKTIDKIKVGDTAFFAKTISESDVVQYAGITGDVNPIVVDEEFAAKTHFKKPLVHGMLLASFFSNVVGTKLPGPGTIHVSYKVDFAKPVHIGDTVEIKVEVTEIYKETNSIRMDVEIINQAGVKVMTGMGIVMPPTKDMGYEKAKPE